MRVGRRVATVLGIAAVAVLTTSSAAHADLAITVPASVNLGSVPSGTSSISGQLGTITVTASGVVAPSFIAKVSATNFTSGSGGTIPKASISYWSGPATAALLQNASPGQLNAASAVTLAEERVAFSSTGLALSITTTWNPSIVIAIPAAAVAGTYSGTITHSVV